GKTDPQLDEDTKFVRQTLGLDPAAQELRIVYGSVSRDNKELAILSRSVLEILIDFGSCVEAPPEDVLQKRVSPQLPMESIDGQTVAPLIAIKSSVDKPTDTFAAVK